MGSGGVAGIGRGSCGATLGGDGSCFSRRTRCVTSICDLGAAGEGWGSSFVCTSFSMRERESKSFATLDELEDTRLTRAGDWVDETLTVGTLFLPWER